jgi:hypothetical protein
MIEEPTKPVLEQGEAPRLLDQELKFLWQEKGQSGETYDLYLGRISRNPVVRSHSTGKYFALPWSLIVKLAVEYGIDQK